MTSIQEEEVGLGQWESVTKSSSHQSVSVSISKGFKSRKSSVEQQMSECSSSSTSNITSGALGIRSSGGDYGKKFKVHKIFVEGLDPPDKPVDELNCDDKPQDSFPMPSSSNINIPQSDDPMTTSLSPVACYKREFSRSDSVSTSGIGSEISENELQASGSWEMSESE